MNRRTLLILLAVVAVLAALLVPKWLSKREAAAPAAAAAGPPPALPVQAYLVRPEPLDNRVAASGSLRANEEVVLSAEAAGKITGIFFQEGARVRSGQLLVQINDEDLRAQNAQIASRLGLAEAQEYRQRVLLGKQAVSQAEYDAVAGELAVLRAQREAVLAQLRRTQVRAPFSGTVGLRAVALGSFVSPGTRIAELQNLDVLKLDFAVPEKYAARVRRGDVVRFRVRGQEQTAFQAQVIAIEPKIDAQTRSLQIRARAANPNARLLPGAFAEVELVLERLPAALLVPTGAVVPEQAAQRVFVARAGKAASQLVRTGARLADRVQITEGLRAGDTVITTGLLQLKPGAPVRVIRVDNGETGSKATSPAEAAQAAAPAGGLAAPGQ